METTKLVTSKKLENKQESLHSIHGKELQPDSQNTMYSCIMTLQRTMGNKAVGQLLSSGELQAKLTVGRPGDKYEIEADQVADKVMGMSASNVQREYSEEETDISLKPINQNLQREPEEDEVDVQSKVQRQIVHCASSGASRAVSSDTESKIQNLRGGGSPMSDSSREFFEPRFGYDFSNVKIHTSSSAADTAQSINARAYTLGNNVVFNRGEYSPESSQGKHLMAHELTHVVQQGAASVRKKGRSIQPEGTTTLGQKNNDTISPSNLLQRETLKDEEIQEKPLSVTPSKPVVQRGILNRIRTSILSKLNQLPGFGLISIVTGRDLVTGRRVQPTAQNIIRAILGSAIYNRLNRYRAVTNAANWITRQVRSLRLRPRDISSAFSRMVTYARNHTLRALYSPLVTLRRFIGPIIRNAIIFKNRIKNQIKRIIDWAWLRAKKWALKNMLLAGGSEGRKIYQMMNRGRGTLSNIARRPGRFFSNFMRSVKMGFTRFKKNFVQHFKNSIFNWLFGVMQGTDIQMPQKFDAKGIFSLVMQVLGLTWTRIRAKIVKQLGPRGEQIMGVLETSVTLVRDLVTRGPVVLLERVQQAIGNLGDMIKTAVIGWVRTTIIGRAIEYLISMLNPAGAIFQLARGIYRVITFFMEKKDQIMGLFNSIVGSIGRIAMGNLRGAASFIENAMGRGLSLLISFLAKLLGLNGISTHIQRVINNVRRPIDNVINGVIRFVVGKARGLMGRVGSGARNVRDRIVNWWRMRKRFQAKDGSSHSLYFSGNRSNITIMGASTPVDINKWLRDELAAETDNDRKTKLRTARTKYNAAKRLTHRANTTGGTNANRAIISEIDDTMKELADALKEAGFGEVQGSLPQTRVNYTMEDGKAGTVIANPLTRIPGNTRGSGPGGRRIPGWSHVQMIDPTSSYWVRMHLLNDNLHGPGAAWNLTPGPKTKNSEHLHNAEKYVKEMVLDRQRNGKHKIGYYKIKVSYYNGNIFKDFPKKMELEWKELTQSLTEKSGTKRSYDINFDPPPRSRDRSGS